MKKNLSNFLGRVVCLILKLIPIKKNHIFFESFTGNSYSGNPKYIYENLYKKYGKKYQYIWSMKSTELDILGEPIIVKRPGIKYLYYAMVSKYWVSNTRLPKVLLKRKGNVYLQTWHGTPLKRIGLDMKSVKMAGTNEKKYQKELKSAVKKWDYLIIPNLFSKEKFESSFGFKKIMLLTGYPRNDLFFSLDNNNLRKDIKNKLKIPDKKKIILYAPTWRENDNEGINNYKFNMQFDLKKLKENLGSDWIMLIRMHYFIGNFMNNQLCDESNIIDVSDYNDISELYLVSDLLVTDYSSVMFDYANTGKPMLFYTYDLENYRDKLRGFYFDFESVAPGPILKNEAELFEAINNIEKVKEDYKLKYRKFEDEFCHLEDGSASARVVEKVWGDVEKDGR